MAPRGEREALLKVALEQFASDNSEIVDALLKNLVKLTQLTTNGHAPHTPRRPTTPSDTSTSASQSSASRLSAASWATGDHKSRPATGQ